MSEILQTERLILQKLTLNDTEFIIELVNSPSWLQYIGYRNIHTKEDAIRYLEDGPLKSYEQNGFGLLLIQLKSTKTPIGMCGLLKRDALPLPDLGYALLPAYEGKGYITEATSAYLAYVAQELQIEKLMAITSLDNEKSIRVLEKLHFIFERYMNMSSDDHPVRLFGWTAPNSPEK
ncbi:MAG: GNAT family N-acetyltransferase [Haliscomenobacter sp.]|uniref:GNAT family N-acetyltransferase n=1 Tax=Haliscomenobacter sp. TaxID=2717303 RepID=UPI0029B787E9|nr:GNAT family N-acetyltransferase [Haliscomenobacter sp.]MDX2072272.1 GNAT family N-acetyltransferase [Haliscomenobacter sp.]